MKVLMINGSPRPNGNISLALREMETFFKAEGIETEIVQVGNKAICGCIACGKCAETGNRAALLLSPGRRAANQWGIGEDHP